MALLVLAKTEHRTVKGQAAGRWPKASRKWTNLVILPTSMVPSGRCRQRGRNLQCSDSSKKQKSRRAASARRRFGTSAYWLTSLPAWAYFAWAELLFIWSSDLSNRWSTSRCLARDFTNSHHHTTSRVPSKDNDRRNSMRLW